MALSFKRDFRLSENQYNKGNFEKTGICVHHTVGGTAESTFHWWNDNDSRVGTAYIIDRDGSLLEVFDPKSWAWQFGLDWGDPDRINFERRFIGIELASEGGILEEDGTFYKYKIASGNEKPFEEIFDAGEQYRGYRYFDRYEPAQIETLVELINHLCDRFDIPRKMLPKPMEYYGKEIKDFEGIIGHVNVRKDKTDPAPVPELWETLKSKCNLTVHGKENESTQNQKNTEKMTDREIDDLFDHNVNELNKMYVPAGGMVKGLIMELERDGRNTYIRLHDAEPDGHIVFYDFIEGDRELVEKIGQALGFKQVTSNKLEVRDA